MNANFDNSAKSVPIGSDTSSTSALAPLMAYLKYEFGSHKFLKGHLLNHDMGGPAWAVNLFPITYRANSEHKNHVELPVEFLLHNLATNQYLSYSVIVDNVMVDKGEPRCEFKCIWGIYDKFTDYKVMQQNDTIVSKLTNNAKKRKSSLMRLTGADRKKYLKIWGHLNNTFDEKKILDIALFNGRKYKNMEKLKYGY